MKTLTMAGPAVFLALALALALGSAPCRAMTTSASDAPRTVLGQGVVEKLSGTTLRINGKDYTIASPSAIFERGGARANPARLVVGKTVAFSLADEGTQPRIKELWIID